jgi:hypothetical protein
MWEFLRNVAVFLENQPTGRNRFRDSPIIPSPLAIAFDPILL